MSQSNPITISSWSLGDQCSLEERIKAAKSAGFEGIGLRAENYVDALGLGLSDDDILALLKKYEIRVTEIEYITEWAEDVRTYEQKYKEQICFHLCDLFGVKHINCGLMEMYSQERIAQKLRTLCQRAGNRIIALEPMPYSGLPDVRKAWEVIEQAGCENVGLLLDSWHWIRAQLPYTGDILNDIPAEKIISIQINDVQPHSYAHSVLRDESMHDRMKPGAGFGNTAGFLTMLRQKGVSPAVIAVEVISDEILSKGVMSAAQEEYLAAKAVLEQAWPELL